MLILEQAMFRSSKEVTDDCLQIPRVMSYAIISDLSLCCDDIVRGTVREYECAVVTAQGIFRNMWISAYENAAIPKHWRRIGKIANH